MVDPVMRPGSGAGGMGLDRLVADAKAKAERYQAMRAAAERVSVTGFSPDGIVTATVDSSGNVTDLLVTDQVQELSGAKVAASVLAAIRKAQAKLAERLREVMAETIGDDTNTIDTIVGNYQAKFPEPEPETEQPPAAQPHASELRIGAADASQDVPPPTPAVRGATPARPRPQPAASDDGDDWADQSIMRDRYRG